MSNKPSKEQEAETIFKNYELYKQQWNKVPVNSTKLPNWLNSKEASDELMLAPASTKLDLVCAYPGGLVEHSLRVMQILAKMRAALGLADKLSASSVILVSLGHDIGKAGTEKQNYYLPQESSWHREKLGMMYTINEELQCWTVSQLSLLRLASLDVCIKQDEWYAISSVGSTSKTNRVTEDAPATGEPLLAIMLQQAVKLACYQGKNKENVSLIQ